MAKKYVELIDKTIEERKYLDETTKRTKYARPGYNYI